VLEPLLAAHAVQGLLPLLGDGSQKSHRHQEYT